MFVRACANAQDLNMMRHAYRLISDIYILSSNYQYAIEALFMRKDLAEEVTDNKALVDINFDLALT